MSATITKLTLIHLQCLMFTPTGRMLCVLLQWPRFLKVVEKAT